MASVPRHTPPSSASKLSRRQSSDHRHAAATAKVHTMPGTRGAQCASRGCSTECHNSHDHHHLHHDAHRTLPTGPSTQNSRQGEKPRPSNPPRVPKRRGGGPNVDWRPATSKSPRRKRPSPGHRGSRDAGAGTRPTGSSGRNLPPSPSRNHAPREIGNQTQPQSTKRGWFPHNV